jgi:hypothetical protein
VPLFGNTYAYNRLGDLDLFDITDINDINLGYCYTTASEKHKIGVMLHMFSLAEDVEFQVGENEFVTESNLGTELDVRYTLNVNEKTSFSAGYATLMPGDVFDAAITNATFGGVKSADSVSRLYAQVRVRW